MNLTPEQDTILKHFLGLDNAELPYRNGYLTGPGHHSLKTCQELEQLQLVKRSRHNWHLWHVTDKGFTHLFGDKAAAMKARAEG